ncbi:MULTISPECIES: hypothetical protein [Thermomonosporaceae]|uniref:hypothetical protein n=1 Tax=Thermomonosporaceae TaxID=2012 RepID=UPI00255B2B46|nr:MULTISPECIES: hypothetical protein [Thermomonosporaceae]MDL4773699.1 hypothetical protein [Actinomadura xylanilytica]
MVLALALLVVGGMALVNALTSEPDQPPGPAGAAPSDSADTANRSSSPSARRSAAPAASATPLLIKVIGPATSVFVRSSDTNEVVLPQTVLAVGETRRFDHAPLDMVAGNGSSLQVTIYGKLQTPKPAGRSTWTVRER